MKLPHLGITQEVRVCDGCKLKLATKSTSNSSTPNLPRAATYNGPSISRADLDLAKKEQEELEKAIAASLAEADKKTVKPRPVSTYAARPSTQKTVSKPAPPADEEEDEDLKAAIAASLADLKLSEERQHKSKYSNGLDGIPTSSAPTNPNELSRVEIDNLKLFADLVERMEADIATRGIGVMHNSQISVSVTSINKSNSLANKVYSDIVHPTCNVTAKAYVELR
jgi:growth factor-regulated tyrosine kinase substrate